MLTDACTRDRSKQPPSSAAHTRYVRGGRRRARRGRARLSPSRRGGEGTKSRVPPSIKAASEAVAVSHTAAAERRPLECKKRYWRLAFSPAPQKGGGEKRRGVSPWGAPQAPRGAGRGAAEPRRKALHYPARACRKHLRAAHAGAHTGGRPRTTTLSDLSDDLRHGGKANVGQRIPKPLFPAPNLARAP